MRELEAVLLWLEAAGHRLHHALPGDDGSPKQLGTLDRCSRCAPYDRLLPCLDFGHINALGQGCLSRARAETLRARHRRRGIPPRAKQGEGRARAFQPYPIRRGGETKHLTLEDDIYGPERLSARWPGCGPERV